MNKEEQNYDYLYYSDEDNRDPKMVVCWQPKSSKQKIASSTRAIYSYEVEYDKEKNCLRARIKNDNPITLNFLIRFKNFKIEKEWLYNKDLICTEQDVIDEYKIITDKTQF